MYIWLTFFTSIWYLSLIMLKMIFIYMIFVITIFYFTSSDETGKMQDHFLKTWTWTKSWEWSTPHRASTPPRRRRRRSWTRRWSERWRSPSTSSSSSRPTSPWSTEHRVAPTAKVSPQKRLSTKTFCRRSSARILWIW